MGTIAYELSGREDWEAGRERPNLQLFLLRLNMNLIAGLTTGKEEGNYFVCLFFSLTCTIINRPCICIVSERNESGNYFFGNVCMTFYEVRRRLCTKTRRLNSNNAPAPLVYFPQTLLTRW